jgi:hypothetical protein
MEYPFKNKKTEISHLDNSASREENRANNYCTTFKF